MAETGEGSRGGKVIRHTKSGRAIYAVAGAGSAYALHKNAPRLAASAEGKAIKYGKQAGRLLGKAGPLKSRSQELHKAAKLFISGGKSADAKIRGGKFALRALHLAARAEQAGEIGAKAGKIAVRFSRAAKILRKL